MAKSASKKPWRRHLRFTREGRVFVFVTFGLGFAAVNTGTNLMYLVFGFMLSMIVLSGILSEHVLRKLHIERRLPGRAFVGEPALIEISVKNGKDRLVSYSVEVEDQAIAESNERRCYFLRLEPGAEQVASYRRIPTRRGVMRFSGYKVSTRFPFGLFDKWRELPISAELLVFPTLLPTPLPEGNAREEGAEAGHSRGRGTETRELREYRVGDEVRTIHWRRSAAMGKPIVREMEREASALYCFMLDNFRPDDAGPRWEQDFEQRISRVAYLAERALARGASVEVCSRGQRSPVHAGGSPPDGVWRFLALLDPVPVAALPALSLPSPGARVFEVRAEREADTERAA